MLDEAVFTAGDLMTRDVAVVHPDLSSLPARCSEADGATPPKQVTCPCGCQGCHHRHVGAREIWARWHEGYTDRQARWLNMLAEGFEPAPAFLAGIQEQHRKVKSVMAPGATTVLEEFLAREVAHLMSTKNIKRVPVVRDGRLVGIVARSDLVRALAQKLDEKPTASTIELETLNETLRRERVETGS